MIERDIIDKEIDSGRTPSGLFERHRMLRVVPPLVIASIRQVEADPSE